MQIRSNILRTIFVLLMFLFLVSGIVGAAPTQKRADSVGIKEFNQAPELDKKVEQGDLPPLEERLPDNPVVVEPVKDIGEYGGTWNRAHSGNFMGWWRMINNIENFANWPRTPSTDMVPNLVWDWEWNQEKTEITCHFVKGIKWSDGETLTVDDFLFWWEDMVQDDRLPQTPPSGTHTAGKPMEVTKVDDYTLKLSFKKSNPIFFQHLARGFWGSAQWIVPSHYLKQFHPEYNSELKDSETNKLLDRFQNRHQYPEMPTIFPWKTVEYESGNIAVFERNPYYWKVDPEGNQLPYIDKVVSRKVENTEMLNVKAIDGELDLQFRDFSMKDIPLLHKKAQNNDYHLLKWSHGDFSWPWLMPGYDHPDKAIRDLMYNKKFRRALSYGIDREQINLNVFNGFDEPMAVHAYPKASVFDSGEGQELLKEWKNSYIEFKPEKAKELLDEIGMTDTNGDGFRERPDGKKFNLIVDVGATATENIQSLEFIKSTWEEIGIKMTINDISGSEYDDKIMNEGNSMMYAWGMACHWFPVMDPLHWAPVIYKTDSIATKAAQYYQSDGKKGRAPRKDSVLEKLQEYYTKISYEPNQEERNKYLLEAFQLHLKEGPLSIGTVGGSPSAVLVGNNVHNVPQHVESIGAWYAGYPGSLNPEQFYFSSDK